MTKAIISVGYGTFVLDLKDALTVSEILSRAEVYTDKYDPVTQKSSFHVHDIDNWSQVPAREFKLLPDSLYRMGKLAGKPDKT